MWGGPTPHNLVTLSLCCAVRTCRAKYRSRVRIETPPEAREGRPYSPSLGHPCPGAGSSIYTQREVPLRLGIRPASSAARRVVGPRRGIPPILAVTSSKEKDWGRTTTPSGSDILFGAVTRIGSCSLEKRQGRFKRKQCVRSDRP